MDRSIAFFLLLSISLIRAQPYDEQLAKRMLPLAAAAYSAKPEECLAHRFNNAELVRRYEVYCDETQNDTCSGYLALLHDEKAIAVVFRGTVGDMQLKMENVETIMQKEPLYDMGLVHPYFRRAFVQLWYGAMGNHFVKLTQQFPDYVVYVTGHSLGAALSSLASAAIVRNNGFTDRNSFHYNFGQPRVGDATFAVSHEKLLPSFYRLTHARDLITLLPQTYFDFRHFGNEIWYNNTMETGSSHVTCGDEDDPACAGDRDSWPDHQHYFTVWMTVYGANGCPTPIP
ncbi:Class 3 lipase protein [Aphelenchoides fujianensis]|nr:Class 3 lipase protein [Aphelenchoides fujianensis]